MVRNKRFSKIQKIQKEIQGIKNRLDDIKQQRQANQLKIENLKDKIRQLKLRTQGLEAREWKSQKLIIQLTLSKGL